MGKLIIFSAPSGSGKSTIINYLLTQELNLAFSISATSRPPRGTEQNGVEYFFLSPDEFRSRIANDEFLEYEEVYQDRFYGTLKAQVEKQLAAGQNVVFDVDVVGGCNIKKFYGERALSVFIQPPSVEELRKPSFSAPFIAFSAMVNASLYSPLYKYTRLNNVIAAHLFTFPLLKSPLNSSVLFLRSEIISV